MKKSFILLVSLLILYLLSGAVLAGEIINETENNIPQITSMPLTITEEGTRYIYEINGLDIEGDQLTYSLEKSPDNMMIGAESGKIVWAPTGVQAGKHEIVIKVVDNNVRETTQNYILDVADTVNNQPVLTSSPVVVAKEGEEYTYDVNADDPDGHKLVYKLLESPTGMIINEVTGEISWIPSSGQAGQHNISINVSDGRGGSTTQDLVVEVESANHAPEIISTPVTEVTVKRNVGEAELMDLSGWEVITYDDWNYEANPSPNWIIDEETNTARQTLNANASILLSDFDLSNHIMEGTWRVDSSADDDFMGFVFAYQNENQYYLFDWKQTSQSYPDYGYAKAGMSVKVVNTGSPPLANDLWESEGNGERVKVLYHNDISYEDFTDYHFSLHFKSGSFTITVKEGEKVLDIINIEDDTYTSGKFGFYNFSQEQLIYQGFKRSLLPGGRYKYDVEAVDQDNDEITYSLIESPEEMIIDSETGEINWLAIKNDIGKHIIKVKAEDEEGLYDIQSYILEVIEEENNPPEITSEPVIEAKEGNEYTYDVEAEDIDGDSLTYSLEQGPEDMAIDNGSGLINWIPQDIDVGNHQIVVSVSDGIDIITQEFIIEVIPTNYSPEITSTPATTTKEAEEYSYDVEAEDSDGDTLTYSLLESPENMTIESSTGLITWLPERGRAGEYNVKVQVVDGNGGKATQEFSIIVESINNPPVINGCEKISQEGHIYKYAIQAEDPEGDELTYNLIDPPAELTIDSEKGIMTWDTENVDFEEYTAGVKVTDSYGAYSSGELILERAKYEPPQITSTPVTSITIGEGLSEDYNYDVEAEDPAGDTLTYSLVSSPEGMTIDADTGLINWTPTEEQIGEHQIDIKVSNTRDAYAQQSYSLIVERLNNSPEITSTPVKNVTAGNEYVYELEAVDPDGDTLTYILKTAPSDMVIYEDTGIVNWIPDSSQVGQHQIEIEVQDGNGGVALQDYTLTVIEESVENTPPVITSTPPANNQLTEDYSYDVEAEDDDGDTLTYSLVQSPAGMIIDDSTGLITWNSTDLQVGTFTVEIEVSDGKGGTASQNYEVTISDQPVNSKPKIISTPVYSGEVGKEYSYDVEAEDVDGDTLTYTLTTAPDGMTIDSSTGMITWTPDDIQSGSNYAIVEVNDGNGGSSSQAFNIQVSGSINNDDDNIRPEVNIELSGPYMESGSTVEITLTATDDVGVVSRRLMVNGEEMTLDENYQAYYQSNTPGVIVVEGYATDAAGNEGYDKKEITFLTTGGDTTPPTAEISSPESGTELTMPTDIKGTASDDAELVLYKLEYSPQGEDKYVEFARGDTSVVDGTLGQFDPTQLKNGYYDVRLTALDGNGNQKSIIETYKVEGQVKVGNFSISFNDINIPVSGIPITVTRTYDSRDRSSGDFGHGWNMDIGNISLKESNHPAKFWYHDSRKEILYGSVPINIYYLEPIRDHIVTISYPDGRVDEFEMIFNPSESEIGPIMETNVEYRPTDGTNSRLEAIGNNTVMPYNGSVGGTEEVELRDSSLDLYNPDRYKLTQSDGTVLIINQNTGLEKITDKHGNEIVIDENGITHSAGKSVQFTRDSEGRITSITDPEGNMINYSYDYYGDLTSVTDQEGNITRFTYNSTHGLIDIIDPRGVRATRNEYDENGRLVAHVDADGNRIEFEHSIGDRQEIVKDRLGNVNVYDYDADGNILQETDALGNKTSYTYDSDGNKTSEKDALGNTISYDYDENGNMLSKTDKNDNKVEYTYNNDDQILSTTDALGNVTTNEYDNDGNLKQSTDVKGNITEYTYDSVGNLIKKTDHKGNEISYSYDRYGNMISQTDEAGNTTSYDYDQNGNPISKTVTRTTSSGVTSLTTGYEYDKKNRLIKTIYHDGSTSQTIYNAIDKVAVEIDRLENRTEYEYDKAGNLAKEIYPDGTEETYEYDVEGNKTSYTDRAGRTTNYEYDAVGQLTKITHSDDSIIETTYNDVGRIQEKTDELGNKTAYTYDPVGNCTSVTDASGNTVKYEYNEQNKKIKMTDAGGNITEYEYNEQGLNTKIIYPDGTTQAMTYDSAGNMLTETDQAGITTEYIYDTLNRLIKVIDVSGNETSYTYDEAGNMLTETDANGNTTSYEYNERGQMIKKTLPLGMTESYSYDLAGNMISRTDYDGNTTTYEYDSNNRLIKKILPDLSSEIYTYTPAGKIKTVKITDAKTGGIEKTTSYEYNNRNRLIKKTNPDGTELEYTYDEVGNRTSVTTPSGTTNYTYDELNRLEKVTDADGGITTYSYDANGNRASIEYSNGTITEYTYDSLNRLIELVNKKADSTIISSYKYTLGPAGNRVMVEENNGRVVEYTYDDLYRLTEEQIYDTLNGDSTISYTYDAVGNRQTKTEDGQLTTYTYDDNNRLLTENNTVYSYDDNGNTIAKTNAEGNTGYSYDYQNRLTKIEKNDSTVEYEYDVAGIRTKKIVDGTETNYLVDNNRPYAQVLEERDSSDNLIVSYTYGDDLISQKRNEEVNYYHYDGLGSTRALTDNTDIITDTYIYDGFGELKSSTGDTENNYLYTGEQYDPNAGFYYLRARYMDPGIGRFINMDTWNGSIYDPVTLHKYLYANADPINGIDPGGHYTIFGLSAGFSVSTSLNSIRLEYGFMMMNNLVDVEFIANSILRVAYEQKNLARAMMMKGYVDNDMVLGLYNIAVETELAGYRALNRALKKNFMSFANKLMNPVQKKIGPLTFDLDKLIPSITSGDIYKNPEKAIVDNMPSVEFLGIFKNVLKNTFSFAEAVEKNPSNETAIKEAEKALLDVIKEGINFLF